MIDEAKQELWGEFKNRLMTLKERYIKEEMVYTSDELRLDDIPSKTILLEEEFLGYVPTEVFHSTYDDNLDNLRGAFFKNMKEFDKAMELKPEHSYSDNFEGFYKGDLQDREEENRALLAGFLMCFCPPNVAKLGIEFFQLVNWLQWKRSESVYKECFTEKTDEDAV